MLQQTRFARYAGQTKKQIAQLSNQLEKAYGKVQGVAIKAVSSPRKRYCQESQTKNDRTE